MCRDGFQTECEHDGCTEIVRCRDRPRVCPEHDLFFDDEPREQPMNLNVSITRPATWGDMEDQGLYRVYVYQGNVIVAPEGHFPRGEEYQFKDATIFIHSNGRVLKNRFGRVTDATAL